MKQNAPLHVRLKELREKKGWTVGYAASQTDSVGRESLVRLESGSADPSKVSVRTAVELIDLYWPKIDLDHFYSPAGKRFYRCTRRTKLR